MTTYYIKKYGVHELHQADCVWLPIRKGTVKLGDFNTDSEAFEQALTRYKEVNPCSACCNVENMQNTAAVKR